MIEIPLDAQHPLRSALLATRSAYGKAVAESIEARLRVTDVMIADGKLHILNLSKAPEQEEEALSVFAEGGKVSNVCTTNSKYVSGRMRDDVWYSETFDSPFWEAVAINCEPDLVLCDGSLSDIHQVQMLKLLFPAVASGGTVVLQQANGSDSDSALIGFVNQLVTAQLRQDKHSIEAADATGYLLRNVEMVSFAMRCVVVRKRKTGQQRLEAVPFSTVASGHLTLDRPAKYSRIPAKITGPERIKQRSKDVLAALADVTAPAAEIGRLKNAVVTGGGIVHTADGYIVEESFINTRHSPRRGPFFRIGSSNQYVSERSLEPVRTASGQFALMKQTWDANYGHWIVDTLPRMKHYAGHMDFERTGVIVNGSVSTALQQMQAAGLRLFGVSPEKLLPVDWQPTRVEELLYVTPSSIPPLIKSPHSIEILESLAGQVDAKTVERFKGHERIYLTRNAYPRRRLLNEDKILPVIEAAGYHVIEPESLTFQEQIALFSQATHVVGNMGAAFSNLAFSPRGVRVLMLATEHMLHDYFYDLVCHKDGEYVSIQGVAANAESGIGADFTIDEKSFTGIFADFDPRF